MKTIRIGSGAGYSGDRIDPAVELIRFGNLDYLVFECLAERTIALAQQSKRNGISEGYDPLLAERMNAILPYAANKRCRIISNMGAANPIAAAQLTSSIAGKLGIDGLRIAAITGDDVLAQLDPSALSMESGLPLGSLGDSVISANAYLGAGPVLEALQNDADVILTGRIADPALFLAPLVHEFQWNTTDWNLLGQGTVVGHLLECAGQLTGGYFADPGYKDVPNLAALGFPLAEVSEDGTAVFSKVKGSGGSLTRATSIEQLLYEVQDPQAYLTPDVTADFSQVDIEEIASDQVRISGGRGTQRPETLKVSVGFEDGFVGDGQISYAGAGALARARLAESILRIRLAEYDFSDLRFDLIGVNSIYGSQMSRSSCEPAEVRLRVACRASNSSTAARVPREVEALYTNGPAGGGGVTTQLRGTVAITSTLMAASGIYPKIHYEVS